MQAEVDRFPTRELDAAFTGEAEVEAYTVMYGGEGREVAHLAVRTPEGKRTWASCDDPNVMKAMTEEEFCGRPVRVDEQGKAAF